MRHVFKFLLLVCFVSLANAEVRSYEELKNEPKSLAKDYYIHRLITETNYNKAEVKELSKDVFRRRGKLATELDKLFGKPVPYDRCKGVWTNNILDANLSCKIQRMNPSFIKNLSSDVRNRLITELAGTPDKVNLLKGFNTKNPAKYYADTFHVENFFSYYKSLSGTERNSKFNFALTPEFASLLGNDKYFNTFITDAVINRTNATLRKSLIDIDSSSFSEHGAFYLGINAIKWHKYSDSVKFFKRAVDTYKKQDDKDKANLWIYLASNSEEALLKVATSSSINMYSIYAKELTGLDKVFNIVIPKPTKEKVAGYDPQNPFHWVNLREKVKTLDSATLKEYATKFDTKETPGEYIYISNILSGYQDNFYPLAFMEHIGTDDIHRKALILALARQESRFVQSAISISYALGTMQFMPFVANDWAAKNKETFKNFDQDDVFNPKTAYTMANIHLDWLEKYLQSPIFVAYAYNGGIGFTKKLITRGDLFANAEYSKFEPFLSMELVTYAESREYAKKVLSNYIVYSQILGREISISELLGDTLVPSRSDSYR
ncbi:MAG: lytic transglycosylase domain-containing protein [Campylobacteraceae bacterium]|nr:lytic transglycosylase domain-containing protein [Campylobacteraceae bacterium]